MGIKKKLDDRFVKFGDVGFISVSKVNDFIDYLEDGKIMGKYCTFCSKYFFPPRNDCFCCFSNELDWFEINSVGRLVSYSQLKFAPKGFENGLPYSTALLDLGKCKIFGRIDKSVDLSSISIGVRMRVVVDKIDKNRISYVFSRF